MTRMNWSRYVSSPWQRRPSVCDSQAQSTQPTDSILWQRAHDAAAKLARMSPRARKKFLKRQEGRTAAD